MDNIDILNLFETAPFTVAIGECIAHAREVGNKELEEEALYEMSEAFDKIATLEAAFALEVE